MRILLTVDQLKRILEIESVHLPLIIRMDKVTKKEFQELIVLIQQKRKG